MDFRGTLLNRIDSKWLVNIVFCIAAVNLLHILPYCRSHRVEEYWKHLLHECGFTSSFKLVRKVAIKTIL